MEGLVFTDEEIAWVDPVAEPVILPAPPRPRVRRETRTLARDLARVRAALAEQALALGLLMLAAAAVLGILIVVGGRSQSEGKGEQAVPAPPAARARAGPASADAPATPVLGEPLGPGKRGAAVQGVQAALGVLGFDSNPPDGFFGGSTGAAVAAFQLDRGLVADGVVGPTTAAALQQALAERARSEATTAELGLDEAVEAGRLRAASAARYRSIVNGSVSDLDGLPVARSGYLVTVLRDVAVHAQAYDEQRALVLFTMLEANARYLSTHSPSVSSKDIEGADGVVYRFFPAHGFQFHPLASFSRLNKLAKVRRRGATARLAAALVSRGIRIDDALVWEYYFPFRGPPRWTSGLAQAAGAQALARSGALLRDPKLRVQARRSFRAIPATLSTKMAGGLWVREYSYGDAVILNAQLQTIVSLSEYTEITGDAEGRAVVGELTQATRALLYRFDTGCWSLYSLGGQPASQHYQAYHVALLERLAQDTGDPLWSETATRWGWLLREPSAKPPQSCA